MRKSIITLSFFLLSISVYGDTRTYNGDVFPFTGNETWNVGKTKFNIEGSMVVPMQVDINKKEIEFLFAVKAYYDQPPKKEDAPVAKEIAKYALEHGYFRKAKKFLKQKGISKPLNNVVGVALIYKSNFLIINSSKGYRYQFPIAELENK